VPIDLRADSYGGHLKRAQDALNAGNALAAEREAIAALTFSPDNANVLLLLSQISDRMKWWDAAEASAERAVAVSPNNAFAHYRVGWCRVQTNRPVQALESLKRATELHSTWGRYFTMWGYALAEAMQTPAKQRELALKGTSVSPNDEWTHSVGAQIFNMLGEPALAEQSARTAISKGKGEGHFLALTCALRLQGRMNEALESAEKTLVDYPHGSGPLAELAEIQAALGLHEQAISNAQKSIERAKDSWESHHALVQAWLAAGDRDKAMQAAEHAYAQHSVHPRMAALPTVVSAGVVLWPTRPLLEP
jgi:tetratricopeptide (TPR) repeat protein